jgi:hypothetical protein
VTYFSQKVELLHQRSDVLDFLCDFGSSDFSSTLTISLPVMLHESNVCVEFSDFVPILTRSWNFDGPCPVEVEMTKSKCQVLDIKLTELGVVQRTVEVSRSNTPLIRFSWSEIEIEDSRIFLRSILLNQVLVDDASRRRILIPTIIVNKEPLGNPLVHNYDGN